jgi:hypothetical protein
MIIAGEDTADRSRRADGQVLRMPQPFDRRFQAGDAFRQAR